MPQIHETISGHRIECPDPDPKLAKFLDRVRALLDDKRKTEDHMVALVYGSENPILDQTIFPERGAVTSAALENPAYHVLMDLLTRKRFAQNKTDVERVAKRYSLSVQDVADRLGVTPGAIRQAIHAHRVPSWVKDGAYFLEPEAVALLQGLPRRGPKPRAASEPDVCAIVYRVGHDEANNVMMQIKAPGVRTGKKPTKGEILEWHRIGVATGVANSLRFFVLEPDEKENKLELQGLFVRGKFRIAHKVNKTSTAREEFEQFKAS